MWERLNMLESIQFKALSFSDFAFRDCPTRYLGERFLGWDSDSPARRYGKAGHSVFEAINRLLVKGEEPDREGIIELIRPMRLNLGQKGRLLDTALWFAEEVTGMKPIDVERLTPIEIAGHQWVMKPDGIRVHERDGCLIIDEYKFGFVPPPEDAKNLVQLQIYALGGLRTFGLNKVRIVLWSIGNRIKSTPEFTASELDNLEPFLGDEARHILAGHKVLQETPKSRWPSLLKHPLFQPTTNVFCGSCPHRFKCKEYQKLILWAQRPQIIRVPSPIQAFKILRTSHSLIEREMKRHENIMRAEVMEAGGEYFQRGWKAWIKNVNQTFKAKKGGKRTIHKLILEPVRGGSPKSTRPSGSPFSDAGKKKPKPKTSGSSCARNVAPSSTRSSRKRGGTGSRREGSA